MRTPCKVLVAVVTALAAILVAGACSSDDRSEGLAAALAEQMTATAEADGDTLDDERARCTAEAYVTVLGVDELAAAGVTEDSLEAGAHDGQALWELHEVSERESQRMARQLFECTDAAEMLAEVLATNGLPPGIGTCVARDLLTDDAYRVHVATELRGAATAEFTVPLDEMEPTMSRCAAAD